jgi:hypothetical protein
MIPSDQKRRVRGELMNMHADRRRFACAGGELPHVHVLTSSKKSRQRCLSHCVPTTCKPTCKLVWRALIIWHLKANVNRQRFLFAHREWFRPKLTEREREMCSMWVPWGRWHVKGVTFYDPDDTAQPAPLRKLQSWQIRLQWLTHVPHMPEASPSASSSTRPRLFRWVWFDINERWDGVIPNIRDDLIYPIKYQIRWAHHCFLFGWRDKDERDENYYLIIF